MFTLLLHIADHIRSRNVLKGKINDIPKLKDFSEATWNFISSIYESGWDSVYINKNNNSFRNRISNKFTSKIPKNNFSSSFNKPKDKAVEIVRLFLSITAQPSKKVLEKSKFFGKGKKPMATVKTNTRQSYTQVANPKVTNILKLKEDFPNLPAKKIKNIHKIINNTGKSKPHIKMTTKGPS